MSEQQQLPSCDCGNPEGHTGAIYHAKAGEVYVGPAHQTGTVATTQPEQMTIEVMVLRCGCDDPDSHSKANLPCPTPRTLENRGVVAYYNRSPIKRAKWQLGQIFKKLRGDYR